MARHARNEMHTKYLTVPREVLSKRRELVARLRCRGYSLREMVATLGKPGEHQLLNPNTNEPFSLSTIKEDCHALDKEWRANYSGDTAGHKARVYMEIQEVKRKGWTNNELGYVLRALKQECDLLGLDAPKQIDLRLIRNRAQEIAERLGVPVGDVLARAVLVAEEAGAIDL